MEHYKTIGHGVEHSWPYEVAVHWAAPESHSSGVICISEGTGHGSAGGNFSLAELLKDIWTTNLEMCDCMWLRDLAREEIERGTLFTADEIWARHQARGSSEQN